MEFTDHLGRKIVLGHYPKRIVSLVPSQTELLFDLGLTNEVVGITKFCVHPEEWFRSKTRVGGTKQLHLDVIRSLEPDLILANKEENNREDIELLSKEFPVWVSDVKTLTDAKRLLTDIGVLVGREEEVKGLSEKFENNFANLKRKIEHKPLNSAIYVIWKDPDMVAGSDTFISEMMKQAGFNNVISETRYPELSTCLFDDPDYVLLSSEPFPFKVKHINEFEESFPNSKVIIVDGEMFSWYGSRMLLAPAYFEKLLQQR